MEQRHLLVRVVLIHQGQAASGQGARPEAELQLSNRSPDDSLSSRTASSHVGTGHSLISPVQTTDDNSKNVSSMQEVMIPEDKDEL